MMGVTADDLVPLIALFCYLDLPRLIEWYFCMNQGLGTEKPARVKRNFQLSDLELSEVNLVTLWRRKFGTGRKTRVIRKFELSEFELTGFNCTWYNLNYKVHFPLCLYDVIYMYKYQCRSFIKTPLIPSMYRFQTSLYNGGHVGGGLPIQPGAHVAGQQGDVFSQALKNLASSGAPPGNQVSLL